MLENRPIPWQVLWHDGPAAGISKDVMPEIPPKNELNLELIMNFDEARQIVLELLITKGKAKNSEMLDALDGDNRLLTLVREDLIFNDLAKDKDQVGLVYHGSLAQPESTDKPPAVTAITSEAAVEAATAAVPPLRAACRIFISYGHDEHAALARRLNQDLKARGHETWFDEERLLPGEDWEACIERGLEWVAAQPQFGRVVLLMTPHSVRRPDGYCLNEIARALGRSLPVVPVMVVWCEAPLSICRIQWLDMRDCVPIDARQTRYGSKFMRLAQALERDELEFDGVHARLRTLLDPLPFDADIAQHLPRFTGRQWVFDQIDTWLRDPAASRLFWIVGSPGVGKTAIAAWLSEHRPEVKAFHLCRHGHVQKSDPRRCVLSIAYQLSTQLTDYQSRLNQLDLKRLIPESDARTLFDRLIVQPLSANFPRPEGITVVLIDALDEATVAGRNELALFLAAQFRLTPDWLRLIITSRPDAEVKFPLQAYTPHVLNALSPDNEDDIRAFLWRELQPFVAQGGPLSEVVVETILARSEGVFLYVEWVRQELAVGRLSLAEPEQFPKGLGEVYAQYLARQFPDVAAYRRDVAPALDAIAAAREPLEADLLAAMFEWSDRRRKDFLRSLGSLFTVSSGRILPFHKSVVDWLTNAERADQYYVSVDEGHQRLAEACWREYRTGPPSMSAYALRHLPAHLIAAAGRWDDLETLLTDLPFLEAKTGAGLVFDLAADFSAAVEVLPADRPNRRILRLLEEAIRRDIHFVARHAKHFPQGLFQCLWNTCWWYDSAEAMHHYPELQNAGTDAQCEIRADGKLHELMQRWRADKDTRQPKFVWVRSLRPPSLPLGTAHLVLGGHGDSIHVVDVSADGERLLSGSRDSTVRLWNTTSGTELLVCKADAPVYAAALSPDGRVIATVPGLRKTVILWDTSTGESHKTLEPHETELQCVAFSADGRFIAAGAEQSTTVVWDVATGERRAVMRGNNKNRIESVAFSPDGALLLAGGGWGVSEEQYIRTWNWQTGCELHTIIAHRSLLHRVIFSPDGGRFASCAGDASGEHTVKIWKRDSADDPLVLTGHTDSVRDIRFSSDGSTLVSGSWDETIRIWDTATGRQLSVVKVGHKVNCAGYLPDGRIYTAGYDNVVRIWDDLSTATTSPSRPDGNDNLWRLAYSPDGQFLATGSERGSVLLWDAMTGRLIGGPEYYSRGPINNMSYSPDSKRLAIGTGHVPWEDDDVPWAGRTDYVIRIMDVNTRRIVGTLEPGAKTKPRELHYSADGKAIIAPLEDNRVVVWDARTLRKIEEMQGDRAAAVVVALRAQPVVDQGRVKVALQPPETVFTDRATGRPIAWFPQPLFGLTRHPGGWMWAGCSDEVRALQNEARKLELVALEGQP